MFERRENKTNEGCVFFLIIRMECTTLTLNPSPFIKGEGKLRGAAAVSYLKIACVWAELVVELLCYNKESLLCPSGLNIF